jgi:hypothetical protein
MYVYMNLDICTSFRENPYVEELLMLKSETLQHKSNNVLLLSSLVGNGSVPRYRGNIYTSNNILLLLLLLLLLFVGWD